MRTRVTRKHIESAKKKLEGKHRCLYCNYAHDDIEVLKRHEAKMHGCFRDKNPRHPSVKSEQLKTRPKGPPSEDRILKRADVFKVGDIGICVTYEWDDKIEKYRMYTDDLKYRDHLEIVEKEGLKEFGIKDIENLREEYKNRHTNKDVIKLE